MNWIIIILIVIDIWSSSSLRKNNSEAVIEQINKKIDRTKQEILAKIG